MGKKIREGRDLGGVEGVSVLQTDGITGFHPSDFQDTRSHELWY